MSSSAVQAATALPPEIVQQLLDDEDAAATFQAASPLQSVLQQYALRVSLKRGAHWTPADALRVTVHAWHNPTLWATAGGSKPTTVTEFMHALRYYADVGSTNDTVIATPLVRVGHRVRLVAAAVWRGTVTAVRTGADPPSGHVIVDAAPHADADPRAYEPTAIAQVWFDGMPASSGMPPPSCVWYDVAHLTRLPAYADAVHPWAWYRAPLLPSQSSSTAQHATFAFNAMVWQRVCAMTLQEVTHTISCAAELTARLTRAADITRDFVTRAILTWLRTHLPCAEDSTVPPPARGRRRSTHKPLVTTPLPPVTAFPAAVQHALETAAPTDTTHEAVWNAVLEGLSRAWYAYARTSCAPGSTDKLLFTFAAAAVHNATTARLAPEACALAHSVLRAWAWYI